MSLGALLPAVLEAVDEPAAAGLAGAAGGGAASRVQVGCLALAPGVHGEGRGTEHDNEAGDAEWRVGAHRAVDKQGKPSDDHERGDDDPAPSVETRVAGPHSRGELGVLGKRPLDLIEQPLLVLRERHGIPPRAHVRPQGRGRG